MLWHSASVAKLALARVCRVFFNIDYYNPSLSYGRDDSVDPAKMRRILTIILASEY